MSVSQLPERKTLVLYVDALFALRWSTLGHPFGRLVGFASVQGSISSQPRAVGDWGNQISISIEMISHSASCPLQVFSMDWVALF